MTTVRRQLLDKIEDPRAFHQSAHELRELQLQAARELFAERREQIPLLQKRAADAGVDEIRTLADLVPLLFSHTAYKSYPKAFLDQGRWARLSQWLRTLTVQDVTQVDVAGVRDIDEWIERFWRAGFPLLATSGTSGKCSLLPRTDADRQAAERHQYYTMGFQYPQRPARDRHFFYLGPRGGPNSGVDIGLIHAQQWGRPDSIHFLSDEPLRLADTLKMVELRKRMAEGSATPGEIAAAEAEAKERAARMAPRLAELTEKIIACRREPMFLTGQWAQHLQIIETARAMGVRDGEFHPESLISAGGGIKGIALPADYRERVDAFYGSVRRSSGYGMTEMLQTLSKCEAGRYHRAPGVILLVLDESGTQLLNDRSDGVVEGRAAFLDLSCEARWGGIISGDRIQVDCADSCPCGRSGPTVLDSIARFAPPGQDDHIGCAGTIDAYIRGAIDA